MVRVIWHEPKTLHESMKMIHRFFELTKDEEAPRLMCDVRGQPSGDRPVQKHWFVRAVAEHGVKPGTRICAVHSEGDHSYDPIERGLVEQGLNAKYFTDEQEALDWVLAESDSAAENDWDVAK
ncbi:MAG: hypothetical protein AAGI17_05860 [Planctomycetota bacterium]